METELNKPDLPEEALPGPEQKDEQEGKDEQAGHSQEHEHHHHHFEYEAHHMEHGRVNQRGIGLNHEPGTL